MSKPSDKPSAPTDQLALDANREIASVMAQLVFPLWSVPMSHDPRGDYTVAAARMAQRILRAFGAPATDDVVRALVTRFARRFPIRGSVPDRPHPNRTAELIGVFGLGRFVTMCARRGASPSDGAAIAAILEEIAPEICDPEGIIRFYEAASGAAFPAEARESFVSTASPLLRALPRARVLVPRPLSRQPLLSTGWAGVSRDKLWN